MIRQREPREECPAFLAFIRTKPCCVCGASPPTQAAHIRIACEDRGKRHTGMSEKPHDKWCTPLCAGCHLSGNDAQHRMSERKFWQRAGINPFDVAEALWEEFGAPKLQPKKSKPRKTTTRLLIANGGHPKPYRPIPKRRDPWPAKGTRKIESRPWPSRR